VEGPDDIQKQFKRNVVQPIVAAAGKEMGKTVEDLLAHGADPSTLERSAYQVIENPQNSRYTVTESLLDIIQKKLQAFREWKEPSDEPPKTRPHFFTHKSGQFRPKKPEIIQDETCYTKDFTPGTYAYWTAQRDFQAKKHTNDKEWEEYKNWTPPKPEDGLEQKKEAVAKVIKELERAEKTLIEAGSKTFAQLYPDLPKKEGSKNNVYPDPKPTSYETVLRFRVPDLNDAKKGGYVKLFEAVWNNDLEKIKALTLGKWSSEEGMPLNTPLKIAIQDGNGFSPFSIAVLQGHYDLARKIVEICATQYHKDDGLRKRFRVTEESEEEDEDEDSDVESSDEEEGN
jgi:hypothetical protein